MTKIEQKIPEGWCVKKIIDVCPLQRGFDLPEQNIKNGKYPPTLQSKRLLRRFYPKLMKKLSS